MPQSPLPCSKQSLWQLLREVKHIGLIAALLLVGFALLTVSAFLTPAEEKSNLPVIASGAVTSSEASDEERRLEEVLSLVDGAGGVRVIIAHDGPEESASGVIVVAEGAGNLSVRLELARAVQSLLGVPQNSIEVLPMAIQSPE